MNIDATESQTYLVGQVGDTDTFRHCSCGILVDGDRGKMLVEDNRSCLSLFVCRRMA